MLIPGPDAVLPRQQLEFRAFAKGRLADLLKLVAPPLTQHALLQFGFIEDHVAALGCQSIAIERHYIDKDYIEDHAIFYSKSLYPYPNYCQRVHFFKITPDTLEETITHLVHEGRKQPPQQHAEICARFSDKSYLGFSVIKPLAGCPVGRTVLRPPVEVNEGGVQSLYSCTRFSKTHFAGIELTVNGLVFQQQDTGVSACATTAIWSALYKIRDLEEVSAATPAQITLVAARHAMPFGRPLPSEGLSTDQMCLAIHALGVSPNLFRVDDFATARAYLYSATKSGIPSVLILGRRQQDQYHAVTIAGMEIRTPHVEAAVAPGMDDEAGDLKALYVHDDRLGPYLSAEVSGEGRVLTVSIAKESVLKVASTPWTLTHILIPMHGKIRLSFSSMREITVRYLLPMLHIAIQKLQLSSAKPAITFHNRIVRPQEYIRELLDRFDVRLQCIDALRTTVPFSRYVGIARMGAPFLESVDVLFDTTSTMRNIICLGVLPVGTSSNNWALAELLAKALGTRLLAA